MSDKYLETARKLRSLNWMRCTAETQAIADFLRSSFPPDDGAEGWIKVSENKQAVELLREAKAIYAHVQENTFFLVAGHKRAIELVKSIDVLLNSEKEQP